MRFAATVVAEGVAAKSILTILCQENFFQLFNLKLYFRNSKIFGVTRSFTLSILVPISKY